MSPVPVGIIGSVIHFLLPMLLCALKRNVAWMGCSDGTRVAGMANDGRGWKIVTENRGSTGVDDGHDHDARAAGKEEKGVASNGRKAMGGVASFLLGNRGRAINDAEEESTGDGP
ncbi:hypothetical protein B296_00008321 [Ensete ventricosum]|uniref:Uncharacterized protein n=1 Tax=Ensete ventricosum TaxID=4639 RepID=A0A427B0A4_ENSVE|nr:hypothetical protein B296_00008321 [Ensete ventricosum]